MERKTLYIDWLKWQWIWPKFFIELPYNISSIYSSSTKINKWVIYINEELSFEVHYRQWDITDVNRTKLWTVAIEYRRKSIRNRILEYIKAI